MRAAEDRAAALTAGDAEALRRLLHPRLRWTTYRGDVFDRETYVAANTGVDLVWRGQLLEEVEVQVVGTAAVLTALVVDEVERDGRAETFRLRITQTWVRGREGWLCLAGHAGPEI